MHPLFPVGTRMRTDREDWIIIVTMALLCFAAYVLVAILATYGYL